MIRLFCLCILSLFAMSLNQKNETQSTQHFSKNYAVASAGKQQLIVFLQPQDVFFKTEV